MSRFNRDDIEKSRREFEAQQKAIATSRQELAEKMAHTKHPYNDLVVGCLGELNDAMGWGATIPRDVYLSQQNSGIWTMGFGSDVRGNLFDKEHQLEVDFDPDGDKNWKEKYIQNSSLTGSTGFEYFEVSFQNAKDRVNKTRDWGVTEIHPFFRVKTRNTSESELVSVLKLAAQAFINYK